LPISLHINTGDARMISRRSALLFTGALFAEPAFAISDPVHTISGTDLSLRNRDFAALLKAVKGKTVVGLGEATHGSKELFDVKSRLILDLIQIRSLSAIVFEAGFAEMATINRYVCGGGGDLVAALKLGGAFSMANQDLLALFNAIKLANEALPAGGKVEVFGYDVQSPGIQAQFVYDQVKAIRPDLLEQFPADFIKLAGMQKPIQAFSPPEAKAFDACLTATTPIFKRLSSAVSPRQLFELTQAILTIKQGFSLFSETSEMAAYSKRDQLAADNILAVQKHVRGKVAVWAHNGHVNCKSFEFANLKLLGECLRDRVGTHYFAIGTAFFEGGVMARRAGQKGVVSNILDPVRHDSLDFTLETKGERYYVLTTEALASPFWKQLLTQPGVMRQVGAGHEPEVDSRTYRPMQLDQQFDALIFIKKVSPTKLL